MKVKEMKLGELLMKDFKDDVTIFDKNNNVIASGNNDDLFDMLGYYFLDLKVLRNDDGMINVDFDLGGDE
ncbi:hypothetical protein OUHCRE1_47780 [Enterobacter asburiae]